MSKCSNPNPHVPDMCCDQAPEHSQTDPCTICHKDHGGKCSYHQWKKVRNLTDEYTGPKEVYTWNNGRKGREE